MRIAILDAWSGVAGDMWVGALLDAGVPLAPLRAAVDAVVIDTSDMAIGEAVARAAAVVEMVLKARP